MRTTVTPEQFERALRQSVRRVQKQAEAAAADACARGAAEGVKLTNDLGLVNDGGYRRGWYHRRIPHGAEYGNSAPHAGVLEHGRRPGATPPPYEPIRAWVRKKLKIRDEEELDRVTQAVIWKIHKLGTRPFYIHHMTRQALPDWYRAALRERLAEDQ